MPDNILFPFFLILSFVSLFIGFLSGYLSYKYSHKIEYEVRMIFWAMAAIACVVFGGLIWAWFLIPIIINHL